MATSFAGQYRPGYHKWCVRVYGYAVVLARHGRLEVEEEACIEIMWVAGLGALYESFFIMMIFFIKHCWKLSNPVLTSRPEFSESWPVRMVI